MVYHPSHVTIGIIPHSDLSFFCILVCLVGVIIIGLPRLGPCAASKVTIGIPYKGVFFGYKGVKGFFSGCVVPIIVWHLGCRGCRDTTETKVIVLGKIGHAYTYLQCYGCLLRRELPGIVVCICILFGAFYFWWWTTANSLTCQSPEVIPFKGIGIFNPCLVVVIYIKRTDYGWHGACYVCIQGILYFALFHHSVFQFAHLYRFHWLTVCSHIQLVAYGLPFGLFVFANTETIDICAPFVPLRCLEFIYHFTVSDIVILAMGGISIHGTCVFPFGIFPDILFFIIFIVVILNLYHFVAPLVIGIGFVQMAHSAIVGIIIALPYQTVFHHNFAFIHNSGFIAIAVYIVFDAWRTPAFGIKGKVLDIGLVGIELPCLLFGSLAVFHHWGDTPIFVVLVYLATCIAFNLVEQGELGSWLIGPYHPQGHFSLGCSRHCLQQQGWHHCQQDYYTFHVC